MGAENPYFSITQSPSPEQQCVVNDILREIRDSMYFRCSESDFGSCPDAAVRIWCGWQYRPDVFQPRGFNDDGSPVIPETAARVEIMLKNVPATSQFYILHHLVLDFVWVQNNFQAVVIDITDPFQMDSDIVEIERLNRVFDTISSSCPDVYAIAQSEKHKRMLGTYGFSQFGMDGVMRR